MRTRSEEDDFTGSHDMRTVGVSQEALMAAAQVTAPTPRKIEAPQSHSLDQVSRDPCLCQDQCHYIPIMKRVKLKEGGKVVKKLSFINLSRVCKILWSKMKVQNHVALLGEAPNKIWLMVT